MPTLSFRICFLLKKLPIVHIVPFSSSFSSVCSDYNNRDSSFSRYFSFLIAITKASSFNSSFSKSFSILITIIEASSFSINLFPFPFRHIFFGSTSTSYQSMLNLKLQEKKSVTIPFLVVFC